MKLFGRLLVVTALLTSVSAFLTQGGAGAEEVTTRADAVSCALTVLGTPLSPVPATNVDITLSVDDSVPVGGTAAYVVAVDGDPGLMNGPTTFIDGKATVQLILNGDPANTVTSPVALLPSPIQANTKVVFPEFSGTIGPIGSDTTVEVSAVRYFNDLASLNCSIPADKRAEVTVGATQPTTTTTSSTTTTTSTPPTTSSTTTTTSTPTTTSTTSSTTSTTSSTTSTTSSTTSTTSSTTSTTTSVPDENVDPQEQRNAVNTQFSCVLEYETFKQDDGYLSLPSAKPMDVVLRVQKLATVGTTFKAFVDLPMGLESGVELPIGAVQGATSSLAVSPPNPPNLLKVEFPDLTNDAVVPSGEYIEIPQSVFEVAAEGKAGDEIKVRVGSFRVPTKTTTDGKTSEGAVDCSPQDPVELTVTLTNDKVDNIEDLGEEKGGTGNAGGSGTDSGSGGTTPTGNQAAEPAPAASGPRAQVIERSAQVDFVCNISLGSSSVPPQDDLQTVTIKTVDKVAPGGRLDFQVRFDPGPSTGPVALPQGVQDFRIGVVAGGAATPSQVELNLGNLPARVETNSNIRVPAASGSVTASGVDGEQVTLTVNRMSFRTTRPDSTTECTAANAPVITTTDIVEGVEVAAETQEQLSSEGASLAVTGSSNTSLLITLALVQLVFGLGLVTFSTHRRRNASRWTYVRN